MTRLRQASVIATLSPLVSAATAHAECAWVRWSFSSDVDRWGLETVHATRQEWRALDSRHTAHATPDRRPLHRRGGRMGNRHASLDDSRA
jgi:hypothetical protein